MTPADYLKGIWGISGGLWLLFGIYVSFRIERFIVKRYEEETRILDTIFFKEHATFTRHIPDFFSSAMYTSHLLMCVWGWRVYKNRKMFRDVDDPKSITGHFSQKEIRQAKWFAISGLIVIVYGVLYYIFGFIWPEVFK